MNSKLILFLPQTSADFGSNQSAKCFRPQNVTSGGTNQKKICLLRSQHCFVAYPTLKTVAPRVIASCDGQLSKLCSGLLVTIAPKILAAPNRQIWLHAWFGPHKLIFQFRGGIFIFRPQQCNRLLRHWTDERLYDCIVFLVCVLILFAYLLHGFCYIVFSCFLNRFIGLMYVCYTLLIYLLTSLSNNNSLIIISQRLSVLIQRFNSALFLESFARLHDDPDL